MSTVNFTKSAEFRALTGALKFFFITILAGLMFVPFIWMLCTAFKPEAEAQLPHFVPHVFKPENFLIALGLRPATLGGDMISVNLLKCIFNSVFVASWVTTLQAITSSLAAFAFSGPRGTREKMLKKGDSEISCDRHSACSSRREEVTNATG